MTIQCPVHKVKIEVGGSLTKLASGVAPCGCVFLYHHQANAYSWCGDSSVVPPCGGTGEVARRFRLPVGVLRRAVAGPATITHTAHTIDSVAIDICYGDALLDTITSTMDIKFSGRKLVRVRLSRKMVDRLKQAFDSAEKLEEE